MSNQQIDPSIFQYDQVYDEIKAPKKTKQIQKESSNKEGERKTSKYIGKMKTIVQRREKDHKRAHEKKQERMNQKLGIGEDQVFITQSFLKKKEQQQKLKKQEQQQQEYDQKHSIQDKATARDKMNEFRKKLLDRQ